MIITEEFLQQGISRNGGWSKEQLMLLGTDWTKHRTPSKGWRRRLIGKEIDEVTADKFLALKDAHLEPVQELFPEHVRHLDAM